MTNQNSRLLFEPTARAALSRMSRAPRALKGALRLIYWIMTPTRIPARYRTIVMLSRGYELGLWSTAVAVVFENTRLFVMPSAPIQSTYDRWVSQHDLVVAADRLAIEAHLEILDYKPLISVIMPVYNTPAEVLSQTLASVTGQLYPHWELCIADDCSSAPHVAPMLERLGNADSRVKFIRRDKNGHIAAASNSALALASGSFVALLDHDDLLAETALYEIAVELNACPTADIIYSDEDKIDETGHRYDANFKPDFSLDLLLGQNLINHLAVYRKSLIDHVGGFRQGFEGSQDYDLALRAVAQTTRWKIRHIPAILYHWRQAPGGQSFSQAHLDQCTRSARKAVDEFINGNGDQRVGHVGEVSMRVPWNRIRRILPNPEPLVSIIVPTRDRVDLLRQCVTGLLLRTRYRAFEILVVDNDSQDDETLVYLAELRVTDGVRVLRIEGDFNFSAFNNAAARDARGEILLLLNNDIDVIEPDWLTEMVSVLLQPDVGIVGAKLLFGDGRVQHAGVRLGAGTFDGGPGVAGHLGLFRDRNDSGYFGLLALTRDVGAVTGACLAVRRDLYDALGGLDESNLKVAFNDIDLCLKVRAAGYRVVWTPFAELYHLESASRGSDIVPEKAARFHAECRTMIARWGDQLRNDPYYNPAFDNFKGDYSLAFPPKRKKPWSGISPQNRPRMFS